MLGGISPAPSPCCCTAGATLPRRALHLHVHVEEFERDDLKERFYCCNLPPGGEVGNNVCCSELNIVIELLD